MFISSGSPVNRIISPKHGVANSPKSSGGLLHRSPAANVFSAIGSRIFTQILVHSNNENRINICSRKSCLTPVSIGYLYVTSLRALTPKRKPDSDSPRSYAVRGRRASRLPTSGQAKCKEPGQFLAMLRTTWKHHSVCIQCVLSTFERGFLT